MNYRLMKSYDLRKLLGSLSPEDRAAVLKILRDRKDWAKKNNPKVVRKKKKKRRKHRLGKTSKNGRADMLRKSRRHTTKN